MPELIDYQLDDATKAKIRSRIETSHKVHVNEIVQKREEGLRQARTAEDRNRVRSDYERDMQAYKQLVDEKYEKDLIKFVQQRESGKTTPASGSASREHQQVSIESTRKVPFTGASPARSNSDRSTIRYEYIFYLSTPLY
jgi:hypothetical protein